MMHLTSCLLLLMSVNAFPVSEMALSPQNMGFNIKLDPNSEIVLESSSCENIESLRDDFLKWREGLDSQCKEVSSCQCGKRNPDKETYEDFRKGLWERYDVEDFHISREWEIGRVMNEPCHIDVSDALPEQVAEMTRRQLRKDLMDEYEVGRLHFFGEWKMGRNMDETCFMDVFNELPERAVVITKKQLFEDYKRRYHSAIYKADGINCFNVALVGGGILDSNRFVSQREFSAFIDGPFCEVVEYEDLMPGDFIVVYSSSEYNTPVHVSVYVNSTIVFEKKGGHKEFPFQFSSASESRSIHGEKRREYFRCENDKEMKGELETIEGYLEAEKELRKSESLLSTIFNHDYKGNEFLEIAGRVKNSLVPITILVHYKYMDTYEDDRRTILKGKDLENKYWFFLQQQIISMLEQPINTNPKWPTPMQLEEALIGK